MKTCEEWARDIEAKIEREKAKRKELLNYLRQTIKKIITYSLKPVLQLIINMEIVN